MHDSSPIAGRRGPPTDSRRALFLLLTGSAGCAMTVLDANIVAVILPSVAREYSASLVQVEWVSSAYVLCFASLLMPAGAISDRFGWRRIFYLGTTGFAAASLLYGLAPTATLLYLARALQGVTGCFPSRARARDHRARLSCRTA